MDASDSITENIRVPEVDAALILSPGNSDGLSEQTLDAADTIMQDTYFSTPIPSPATPYLQTPLFNDQQYQPPTSFDGVPSYGKKQKQRMIFDPSSATSSLDSLFSEPQIPSPMPRRCSQSGQSPRSMDLILPVSEFNARTPAQSSPGIETFDYQPAMLIDPLLGEDIEDIVRQPPERSLLSPDMWMSRPLFSYHPPRDLRLYHQPFLHPNSSEMLMLRFDKQTCGILSVKDGPTENPWRTLIWPLARDSPALYHAIASMTAFHTSGSLPALRLDGVEHMRRSISALASNIAGMRTDTALATTLALAFSESWDQHISTGIEHLRGARALVRQALARHYRHGLAGEDLARLKFLCNTWLYMDVLSRLTSPADDDPTDFGGILDPLSDPRSPDAVEVDPLMACATTLFPLIGGAANLCRKVRTVASNSIAIISAANELKSAIEAWTPPACFESPEDPSSEIHHGLQTAEAYRYATLLHLHQAVPEIPSLTSKQLAAKTLVYLATVPLGSRMVIVQIYPLLAAGCEAEGEDRVWVRERWEAMSRRMWLGNVEKCMQVTGEVWRRRDWWVEREREGRGRGRMGVARRRFEEEVGVEAARRMRGAVGRSEAPPPQRGMGRRKSADAPVTEMLDPEMTVRGGLHWAGVMTDWAWEGETPASSLL